MSPALELRVAVLREGQASLPRYASAGAAGMDLCAALEAPLTIAPGARSVVPTGLAFAIPEGYEGQVRPRSGLAAKHGLTVLNAPGTIDCDYRGEVKVALINHGQEPYTLSPGERMAQLVITPVSQARIVAVQSREALGDTARGTNGFGSTGRTSLET